MVETLEITNFSGRLTRIQNGDINSGFAKFTPSFGYDPFSKPMNLTWFEQPVRIADAIDDLPVAAKPWFTSSVAGSQNVLVLGSTGKIYRIVPNASDNPNLDSIIGISSIAAPGSQLFPFGGSMEFFGTPERMYIGDEAQVYATTLPPDGTKGSVLGDPTAYVKNVFRPLQQFQGGLLFGNGNTVGKIDATGTIVSSIIGTGYGNKYSELNPPLPTRSKVTDLDNSMDGNYLMITASGIPNENIVALTADRQAASSSDGNIFKWNGSDQTITTFNTIPSYAVTALQTYLQHNLFFSNDSFGASMNDGVNKIITLPNNKSPSANATTVNGNFVSWVCPETNPTSSSINAAMYYFGALDQENPSGLYRMFRQAPPLTNGFVFQTPVNILTNNKYSTLNSSASSVQTLGYAKHYFSTYELNGSNQTPSSVTSKLYRFLVTSTGSGTPQLGVYETQTQLFSKRISVNQVRVYTEPTVTGNGFQIDLIGGDGNPITNGTFTYTFAAGSDETKLQGALERINFNPDMKTTYALGVRVTNTGSTNMTIKKIEVDWQYSGK